MNFYNVCNVNYINKNVLEIEFFTFLFNYNLIYVSLKRYNKFLHVSIYPIILNIPLHSLIVNIHYSMFVKFIVNLARPLRTICGGPYKVL